MNVCRYEERVPWISRHINGSVLDAGCVGKDGGQIHKIIAHASRHTTGIDLNERGVKRLRSEGYDVELANAETFTQPNAFDTIVAGELIEHLSNPGLFLERCQVNLKRDGRLILTTPNARSMLDFIKFKPLKRLPALDYHVIIFDHYTLENLLERHGFRVVERIYTDSADRNLKGKLLTRFMLSHSTMIGIVAKRKTMVGRRHPIFARKSH